MIHLDGHPHAFIKDGEVFWVGVFNAHDNHELFESVKQVYECQEFVCCCNFEFTPEIGWKWNGNGFYLDIPVE